MSLFDCSTDIFVRWDAMPAIRMDPMVRRQRPSFRRLEGNHLSRSESRLRKRLRASRLLEQLVFEGDFPNDCEQSKGMPLTSRPVTIQTSFSSCILFSFAVMHAVQAVVVVVVRVNSRVQETMYIAAIDNVTPFAGTS